jgi:PAS domain S-box-containing protein
VGTDGGGLARFDPATQTFAHFRHRPEDPRSLSGDMIRFIHRDRAGRLWIGTMGGGLNRLDGETGRFVRFRYRAGDPDALSTDNLLSFCEDRSGILWIGTLESGLSRIDPMSARFRLYRPSPARPGLVDRTISYLHEDRDGTVLLSTRSGDLVRFDPTDESFAPVRPEGRPLSKAPIYPTLVDRTGVLWVGTWGDGLIAVDRISGTVRRYRLDPDDPDSLPHNLVASLAEDPRGNIWIGTFGGGLARFDRKTERFVRFQHDPNRPESLADDRILSLLFHSDGSLWISVIGRGLDRLGPGASVFEHFPTDGLVPGNPVSSAVNNLLEDRAGNLWAGTNAGLRRLRSDGSGFDRFAISDDSCDDSIQSILEDDRGRLWLGTNGGLCRFDPRTGDIRNYDARDGLQGNAFGGGSRLKTRDGMFYFGGNDGFNRFRPENIRDNPHVPSVVPTEFRIHNRSVTPGPGSPLDRPIHLAEEIVLRPDRRVFSIGFAALDFSIPQKNRYAYRMEGVDPDWVFVDATRRFAAYTNLAPGQYRFEVRGANNDGLWNEEGTSIRVRILPPWWAALWFRTLALLLSGFALAAGFRWRVRSIRNRNRELAAEVSRRTLDLESINRHLLETMGEQDRIAEALRESEERFRLAFENASVGICLVDMEGRFTRINRRMAEIFGYSPDELTGMSVNDITHPEDVDRSPEFIRKALAGEATTGELEKRYFRKNGEPIWGRVVSSLARNAAGEPLYFISHVEDITERKAAADALRVSHERFAAVMDGINSLMYVADLETYRVLFANRAFRERFGEVEGRICWQVIQEGMDGPCGFCSNPRLLDDRGKPDGVVRWELRNTRNRRWYRVEDQAIPWVDGRLVRMSFATDITGLKDAEASLREARDAAESANRAKSRFLASIGHEIRTPMNAILGFADLLLARETDPRKRDSLTTLRDSGYALLRLLNDLLDLSRIEAGRLDLRPKSCRPISLLAETEKLFRPEAERKSLSFALDTTDLPDVAVRMDPVRFRQILTNLTGNALKYTRAGGIRIVARGRILGDRFRLSIEIADTGLGIPAESMGDIFDAFTRAHVDIPDAAGGTGLGLAISRELAERMGGNLMVASAVGEGTVFRLLLPAVPMDGARETEPAIAPAIERGADAGPSPLFPDPASDTDLAAAVSGMVPESPEAGPPAKTAEPEQPAAADDRLRRLGESLAPLWEKARRKQYMPDIQAFAEAMRAEAADVPALAAYANALLAEIQSYDVPAILARLEAFPARPDPGTASAPPISGRMNP